MSDVSLVLVQCSVVSHVSSVRILLEVRVTQGSQLSALTININMFNFSRTPRASSQTSISASHIVPKLQFHDRSWSINNWKLNNSISTLFSWINWSRYQVSMRWFPPRTNPLHLPSFVSSYNMSYCCLGRKKPSNMLALLNFSRLAGSSFLTIKEKYSCCCHWLPAAVNCSARRFSSGDHLGN